MNPPRRIWVLIGAMSVAASMGWAAVFALGQWRWTSPELSLAGALLLAAAFVITERLEVFIEFRGELSGVDLSEISFIVALAFGATGSISLGLLAAVAADWLMHPRRGMAKGLFTVANRLLSSALGVLAFYLVTHGRTGPLLWLGGAVAAAALAVTSTACAHRAIVIVNGPGPKLRSMIEVVLVLAAGSTLLGLTANELWASDPRSIWMIGVAASGLWLGYRTYMKLRQRYGSLDLLHTFSHGVAGVTETDEVTITTLSMAKELLRGEHAQLVFRFPDGIVVKRLDEHGVLHSEAHRSGFLPPQVELFGFPNAIVVGQDETDPELKGVAEHLGWNDLAAAPLGTDGFDGMLVVANRLADVSTFDVEDLRILETFAQNTGVALKVGELVDELRREVAEKDFQAMHDSLTGLPNRERLHQVLDDLLLGATEDSLVAVALMDLDDFKDVNDTLGHTTGDALLEEIARRLSAAVGGRGTVARLGGDEFAVAWANVACESDALAYIERLKADVEAPYVVDRLRLAVRFSIGLATAPTHGNEARILLQRADIAMYAAKKGRQGVKPYAAELDTSSTRRLSLAGELAPALANGDFQLFYQPQLDLRTGTVTALEALARWPHAVHRSVPPDEFIPLVEQSGLIGAFTDWAIDTALRDTALWREQFPDLRISVNMSARNLLQNDFAETVRGRLREHDLPAAALTLELTESEVMSDPDRALAVLTQLHQMGIRIAIDDFGTGYSSLSYLKRLPVAEVKIDRSFVMNMLGSKEDIAIVESTIDLADSLGMETVAEGVETLDILRRLAAVGCWSAQGYHVARPLPSADVADKILEINAEYAGRRQIDPTSTLGFDVDARPSASAA